jgi:hypothetical protein
MRYRRSRKSSISPRNPDLFLINAQGKSFAATEAQAWANARLDQTAIHPIASGRFVMFATASKPVVTNISQQVPMTQVRWKLGEKRWKRLYNTRGYDLISLHLHLVSRHRRQ